MKLIYQAIATTLQKKLHVDAHYFLKGGFWLGLTQVIALIGSLVTSVLLAYYLTPQNFGVYRYLIGLSALFTTFSLTGLGQSIIQTAAQKYSSFYQETVSINFYFTAGIFLSAIAGSTYYYFNNNLTLSLGCLLISILTPIIATFGNIQFLLHGQQQYRLTAHTQIIRTLFITTLSVSAVFLTKNVLVLLGAYLISSAFSNIVIHFIYKPKKSSPTPQLVFERYISFARNTSVRNIIANIANQADNIIIFTHLGGLELATYTIATLIPEQVKGSFKNLANLLLPKYAQQINKEALRKNVTKRSLQMAGLLAICTIVYIFLCPLFFATFFPKYSEAIFLSQLVALSFPSFVLLIPYSFLHSMTEEKILYRLQTTTSILQIFLTIILTIKLGILGAILSRIIHRYIFMLFVFSSVNNKANF